VACCRGAMELILKELPVAAFLNWSLTVAANCSRSLISPRA
jgi:hypothetical protein